jgi:ABC-type branched-subunit amino acid transport system substrate-binding protein
MMKTKWFFATSLILILVLSTLFSACSSSTSSTTQATTSSPTTSVAQTSSTATTPPAKAVTLYVGGTFALTGAYAEDCAADLAGFQDYVKYVNDNKIIAPWYTDKKIPANITFELLWADDALAADKTLIIYDDFKSKGMLVERISGSPEGMALKDKLIQDNIGATGQSASPAYLAPPGNIFTNAPIYTDQVAAIAEWFLKNWKDTSHKPRVAYLTADSTLGRGMVIPELESYLTQIGFEYVGAQYVPMVPTSPPTTQLAWLKDNKVDLALGTMINPGSQPTIKEAVRLGMGPDLAYKITFGFAYPAHLQIFVPALGETGNGVVVAGDFCAVDAPVDGVKFMNDLQNKYRPDKKVTHVMYLCGMIEAMTQVEALRLAALQVSPDKLTAKDVLEKGFQQIKNFSTGGITISPFNYGPGDVEGVDQVRLQQVQNGKIVEIGSSPLRGIFKK